MVSLTKWKENKKNYILNNEYTFKEICDNLDKRKSKFEKSWSKGSSIEKVWDKYLDRKNTFLTSK